MMRPLYAEVMGKVLDAAGVKFFTALEIADVGRIARGKSGPVRLEAPPVKLYRNILPTLEVADWLRERFGPLRVTSGYRDPTYNEAIGSTPGSLHVQFNALDLVSVEGATPELMAAYLETHPKARHMGIGIYPTFVHLDTRGIIGRPAPARWPQRTGQKLAA